MIEKYSVHSGIYCPWDTCALTTIMLEDAMFRFSKKGIILGTLSNESFIVTLVFFLLLIFLNGYCRKLLARL